MAKIDIKIEDGSVLGNPAVDNYFVFFDSNNSDLLTTRDSTGTDTTYVSGGGGGAATLRNISSTNTFATANETINCTANTFTVNLPTAVGIRGTVYTLVNSGTGIITLDGNGTETINGSLTIEIKRNQLSRTVQSDGTNWIII
tara:strand:- start:400 stop:828 length:429 start_codon:yes stop_codon:yes gene_type:complete